MQPTPHAGSLRTPACGAADCQAVRLAGRRTTLRDPRLGALPAGRSPLASRADRPLFELLFANYLAFLARHRDTVERKDGMVLVDSTTPEFVCVVLEDAPDLDAVPERFRVARLLPWSRLGETELLARGFAPRGALNSGVGLIA